VRIIFDIPFIISWHVALGRASDGPVGRAKPTNAHDPFQYARERDLQLSEKIALAMVIWVVFALILALNSGLEVFLTLILIGVLIVRELTDSFTPVRIKERVDFFIYAFLIIFAAIVVRRVWEILG